MKKTVIYKYIGNVEQNNSLFNTHEYSVKIWRPSCTQFLPPNKNKKYVRSLIKKINKFLKQTLDLDLNYKKTKLKDVKEGIDFLGYITKPNYVLVRKRIINNGN